jgi:hypothetical protein
MTDGPWNPLLYSKLQQSRQQPVYTAKNDPRRFAENYFSMRVNTGDVKIRNALDVTNKIPRTDDTTIRRGISTAGVLKDNYGLNK